MRLLAWNIRQGGSDAGRIVEAIQGHAADIVALTEFWSGDRGDAIRAGLEQQGFLHQETSNPPHREHGVLVASRVSFSVGGFHPSIPHRAVEAVFEDFKVLAIHIPDFGHKWDKPAFWRDVLGYAQAHNDEKVLMVGDFNTGFGIDAEGTPFACQKEMKDLVGLDWTDTWRSLHPDLWEFTWYSRGKSRRNGFRLDYGFLSPALKPSLVSAEHSHREREENVSDHSALILELAAPIVHIGVA